jgi:foldase protein PrsA
MHYQLSTAISRTIVLTGLATMLGCAATGTTTSTASSPAPAAQQAGTDAIISRMDGSEVREVRLNKALQEAYGLDMLIRLVLLDLSKMEAQRAGVKITPDDLKAERYVLMKGTFPTEEPDQYEKLMPQLLKQLKLSPRELDLVVETNANLRAISKQMVAPKLTEEVLKEAFNGMYGEKVKVRHIALANIQEVTEAKRRLAAGEKFEDVASSMSRVASSRRLGGMLPAFPRGSNVGKNFADAAFALRVGEVSDAIHEDKLFHIIKLEERIAPVAVKFENYRELVRQEMETNLTQEQVVEIRKSLSQRALRELKIDDPELKKQWDANMAAANEKAVDKKEVLEELKK